MSAKRTKKITPTKGDTDEFLQIVGAAGTEGATQEDIAGVSHRYSMAALLAAAKGRGVAIETVPVKGEPTRFRFRAHGLPRRDVVIATLGRNEQWYRGDEERWHAKEKGYVAEAPNPHGVNARVTIYFTAKQEFEGISDQLTVVCDGHGWGVGVATDAEAVEMMKHPERFCAECAKLVEGIIAMNQQARATGAKSKGKKTASKKNVKCEMPF